MEANVKVDGRRACGDGNMGGVESPVGLREVIGARGLWRLVGDRVVAVVEDAFGTVVMVNGTGDFFVP